MREGYQGYQHTALAIFSSADVCALSTCCLFDFSNSFEKFFSVINSNLILEIFKDKLWFWSSATLICSLAVLRLLLTWWNSLVICSKSNCDWLRVFFKEVIWFWYDINCFLYWSSRLLWSAWVAMRDLKRKVCLGLLRLSRLLGLLIQIYIRVIRAIRVIRVIHT